MIKMVASSEDRIYSNSCGTEGAAFFYVGDDDGG